MLKQEDDHQNDYYKMKQKIKREYDTEQQKNQMVLKEKQEYQN